MTVDFQLRRQQPEDAPAIYEAVHASRVELGNWTSWCHAEFGLPDVAQHLQRQQAAWAGNQGWSFSIVGAEGQVLGCCGIHGVDTIHGIGELGYWVRTSATGKGIATEATRRLLQWAFKDQGLHRIEIVASVKNLASQRVAEKAGAKREGIMRDRLCLQGTRHDAVLFAVLKGEF